MEKKEQRTRRVGYGKTEQKEPELMATAGKKAGEGESSQKRKIETDGDDGKGR